MTKQENNAKHYRNRKERGLCPNCGKELDRDGHYCEECLMKHNQMVNEDREFLKSIGICPVCRKIRLFGDEKKCLECKAKDAEYQFNRRNKNREKYNNQCRQRSKKREEERRQQGLCPRCGKKAEALRYKMCSKCRHKNIEYKRKSRPLHPRTERIEKGICYFCDNPVKKGYKVCDKHYQMNVENGKLSKNRIEKG